MGRFTHHAYAIPVPKKGEKSRVHRIKTAPFHRGHELLDLVNQGGKIKLHALVDNELPVGSVDILVVGTGCDVDDNLVDRIQKIGSLLLNDGQFGYHYYLVSPAEGSRFEEDELVVTINYDDRKGSAGDLEATIVPFQVELRSYDPEICFEGSNTLIVTFRDSRVRHEPAFKQMRDEIYEHHMVTGVKLS